jgi:hypothetical protein
MPKHADTFPARTLAVLAHFGIPAASVEAAYTNKAACWIEAPRSLDLPYPLKWSPKRRAWSLDLRPFQKWQAARSTRRPQLVRSAPAPAVKAKRPGKVRACAFASCDWTAGGGGLEVDAATIRQQHTLNAKQDGAARDRASAAAFRAELKAAVPSDSFHCVLGLGVFASLNRHLSSRQANDAEALLAKRAGMLNAAGIAYEMRLIEDEAEDLAQAA